jgi:hypothetical protein
VTVAEVVGANVGESCRFAGATHDPPDPVELSPSLDCLIEEYIPQADPEIDDAGPFDHEPEKIDVVLADHLDAVIATGGLSGVRSVGRRSQGSAFAP